MIRTTTRVFLLLLAAAPLLAGCDALAAQDEFERAAASTPSGIFRTDDGVTALAGEDDADDWRVSPLYVTSVFVASRAFPNPAPRNAAVTIQITVTTFDTALGELRAIGFTDTGRRVVLDVEQGVNSASTYTLTFVAGALVDAQPGLRRVLVFDSRSRLVTYGDVLIQG